MFFLLHLALFLYGLAGLVIGKIRTTTFFDLAPGWFLQLVATWFPETIYQPWQPNVDKFIPNPGRGQLISGAITAYSFHYLFTHRRA